MSKRYKVIGTSYNCGTIKRTYYDNEIRFAKDEADEKLNGYLLCVANRYHNNPRFKREDVTIIEF